MHASRPLRAALAALLATLLSQPTAAAASGRPAGVAEPAPATAYDTLRHATEPEGGRPDGAGEPAGRPLPLLLDNSGFGFGTSVVFDRLPTPKDLGDLALLVSVEHVVVSLPGWPAGYEALQPLGQSLLPEGADLIVILPGYPPSRAAAEAWNYLRLPLRLVLVVDGPPGNRAGIDELNRIRGLERVVADMEQPSRTGFERLQRPLSFRVVKR